MIHGCKWLNWVISCACSFMLANQAFAQDPENTPDDEIVADDDNTGTDDDGSDGEEDAAAFMDAIRSAGNLSDDAADYAEIHEMRVLERSFIPTPDSDEVSVTLPPGNLLELSHDAAMHMLVEGVGQESGSRGLQRQASRLMASAIAQVKKQIADSGNALEQPFGLDCIHQPAVQEYLAIFSSPASKTMKTWLKRMGRYQEVLEKALAQENVPTDLIYLAMIESGFKMKVKSPASATGMWQFMAPTGATTASASAPKWACALMSMWMNATIRLNPRMPPRCTLKSSSRDIIRGRSRWPHITVAPVP